MKYPILNLICTLLLFRTCFMFVELMILTIIYKIFPCDSK